MDRDEGLHAFDVKPASGVVWEAGDAKIEPSLAVVLVGSAVVIGDRP